jgi:predicted DsbA family dithiol-disulfide isomerase
MEVEIWSDVVCPWCYIGKRRFEAALAGFAHRDQVAVTWRAFELDPAAPAVKDGEYAERLAAKYRIAVDEARQMISRMVETGAATGLSLRFDLARGGNTFDAHRLLHLARSGGVQGQLYERLLAANFTEGVPVGDKEALLALAVEAGLDPDEVREVLEGDAYAADVRDDERQAHRLGISSVPFFVFGGTYGVAGAQSPEVLLGALEQAWAEVARAG